MPTPFMPLRGNNKKFLPFMSVGIPMLFLCFGGVYMISKFQQTKNEIKDKKEGSISTRKFNLEEEHKMISEKLNIDDYKLSRIPRPEGEAEEQKIPTEILRKGMVIKK